MSGGTLIKMHKQPSKRRPFVFVLTVALTMNELESFTKFKAAVDATLDGADRPIVKFGGP